LLNKSKNQNNKKGQKNEDGVILASQPSQALEGGFCLAKDG
jgi:hypothetical protein